MSTDVAYTVGRVTVVAGTGLLRGAALEVGPAGMVTFGYARIPCGCAVYVGFRDNGEPGTACVPCGPGHLGQMIAFNARLRELQPSDRPVIDVIVEQWQ